MGSVGDAYDNTMCESFFATLECELLDRHRFQTQAEARLAVFEYLEGWYNPHRRHSALDYRSPSTTSAVRSRSSDCESRHPSTEPGQSSMANGSRRCARARGAAVSEDQVSRRL